MRVAIDCRKITDFGIGTYIRGLLSGLEEAGGELQYVVFAPERARALVPARFEVVVTGTPNYSIRELFAMARLIRAAGADVYHSPHYVVPFTDVPVVTTLHDVILFRYPPRNPLARIYLRAMNARAVRRSARVLAVTEAAKRDLMAILGCRDEQVVVTPNGVAMEFFEPVDPASGEYFLFVGNDKPHKNVSRLVAAFRDVCATRPGLELRLVGGDFLRFEREPGVRALGFVDDQRLRQLYRGALALVIPSLDEGFGLPAAEALAAGVPVVASNIPALVEVTGGDALFFDPRSVDDLAAALSGIARDPELRKSLGAKGHRRAEAFSWRRCAELTIEAYRYAASTRR